MTRTSINLGSLALSGKRCCVGLQILGKSMKCCNFLYLSQGCSAFHFFLQPSFVFYVVCSEQIDFTMLFATICPRQMLYWFTMIVEHLYILKLCSRCRVFLYELVVPLLRIFGVCENLRRLYVCPWFLYRQIMKSIAPPGFQFIGTRPTLL